jgi:5-hydroxyisourate hydrolase
MEYKLFLASQNNWESIYSSSSSSKYIETMNLQQIYNTEISMDDQYSTNRRVQTILKHMEPAETSSFIQTSATSYSQPKTKISLSSHVLETGRTGKPYPNLKISLYCRATVYDDESNPEILLATGYTNDNGRVTIHDWKWVNEAEGIPNLQPNCLYRVRFWLRESGYDCMYPFVDIHFQMKPGEHYHIPLLLNPYGYTTYKGS